MKGDEYYMNFALKEAEKALEAGDFPVGCVLVKSGSVLASGRRLNTEGDDANELDHAEIMALRSLLSIHSHVSLDTVVVYSTMEPCLMCFTTMLLSGIRSFVWGYEDVMGGGMNLNLQGLNPLYQDMKIISKGGIMRPECLKLYQKYFARYSYLENSLLATYTLSQKV